MEDAGLPRLLVVDDQPVNVQVLYRALSREYRVIKASSGDEALAICRREPPELVLLDVVMPDPDGHAVCRALKADAGTRDIPVIFVTAQDDPADEALGLDLGAVDFIAKPVNPAVVRARVRTQLALKRSTAALAEFAATLEQRVAQRTRELEAARAAADAANRAKSDFLSNISHEIRTPLNSILGMTHLALQGEAAPRQRELLGKIGISGRHLLALVDELLDFSKIEAGKLELEHTELRIADVMRDLHDQLSPRAAAKGLMLSIDVEPQLDAPLAGDPLRLLQVLLNYAGNAIKFSDAGCVQVRARRVARDADGVLLRFEVEDQGIGMTEAQVAQLFQSFHQADASTTRRYGGTGLGLALCKRLAEAMGGEVGVTSRPGHGSLFWFTARLAAGGAAPAAGDGAAELADGPQRDLLAGRRILVVDDSEFNREVAGEILKAAGAGVALVDDGRAALERLAGEAFDLVLMDMQMPQMDGLEATRLLRADPALAGITVLGLTANARREDLDRCLAAGMDDALPKPILPRQLYATIQRLLARPPRGVPAAAAQPPARDPELIDLGVLEATLRERPERVRKYALMFRDTLAATRGELDAALAAARLPQLREIGHRARSAAATVGAMRLAQLCQSLQQLGDGALPEARALVEQIGALSDRIHVELERAFGAGPARPALAEPAAAEAD